MEKIMRPVWAEIDLDILANNMRNIKNLTTAINITIPTIAHNIDFKLFI